MNYFPFGARVKFSYYCDRMVSHRRCRLDADAEVEAAAEAFADATTTTPAPLKHESSRERRKPPPRLAMPPARQPTTPVAHPHGAEVQRPGRGARLHRHVPLYNPAKGRGGAAAGRGVAQIAAQRPCGNTHPHTLSTRILLQNFISAQWWI